MKQEQLTYICHFQSLFFLLYLPSKVETEGTNKKAYLRRKLRKIRPKLKLW